MRKLDPKKCECSSCTNTFVPMKKWQRFCSPSCRNNYWSQVRSEAIILWEEKQNAQEKEC